MHRSWQAWPDAAKLVCHAHDYLATERMANQHLGEESQVAKELKNISCGTLHGVAPGCCSNVCRVPMAAQVNKKELPRGKCLYDYSGVIQRAIPAMKMVSWSGGSNAQEMA